MEGFRRQPPGFAVVVSGPSGVGKNTVVSALLERDLHPEAFRVVTWTTRAPRPGEKEGVDYHFVSKETLLEAHREGKLLEYAFVHSAYYGTPAEPVLRGIREGQIPILVVDVQGARVLRTRIQPVITVFLAPPSWERLRRQQAGRDPDSGVRMQNARWELRQAPFYDYIIENADLEKAVQELSAIITAEKARSFRRKAQIQTLLEEREP